MNVATQTSYENIYNELSIQFAQMTNQVFQNRLISYVKKLNAKKGVEKHKVVKLSELVRQARHELQTTKRQVVLEDLLDELEVALLKL